MTLQDALTEHAVLHHRVGEYARKPDGSLKPDDLSAEDKCGVAQWFSTVGAAHEARPEHATLAEAHSLFHRVSAKTVRKADAGTLEEGALGEKGELKTSFVNLCVAIARMNFTTG